MKIHHYTSTTPNDFNPCCEEPKQRFASQGYQPPLINKHMKAIEKNGQEQTFRGKRQHHLKGNKNYASINMSLIFTEY